MKANSLNRFDYFLKMISLRRGQDDRPVDLANGGWLEWILRIGIGKSTDSDAEWL